MLTPLLHYNNTLIITQPSINKVNVNVKKVKRKNNFTTLEGTSVIYSLFIFHLFSSFAIAI